MCWQAYGTLVTAGGSGDSIWSHLLKLTICTHSKPATLLLGMYPKETLALIPKDAPYSNATQLQPGHRLPGEWMGVIIQMTIGPEALDCVFTGQHAYMSESWCLGNKKDTERDK